MCEEENKEKPKPRQPPSPGYGGLDPKIRAKIDAIRAGKGNKPSLIDTFIRATRRSERLTAQDLGARVYVDPDS